MSDLLRNMMNNKLASLRSAADEDEDDVIDVEVEAVVAPLVEPVEPTEPVVTVEPAAGGDSGQTKAKTKSRVKPRKSPLLEASAGHSDVEERSFDAVTAAVQRPISSSIHTNPLTVERKLDKKAKAELERKWSATEASTVRAAGLQGIVQSLADKIGADSVFRTEADFQRMLVGVPVGSIALEWVMANDVLPLGSPIMLAGAWGTGKSALLYEMLRWTCASNGFSMLLDTELKADLPLVDGLIDRKRNSDFFTLVRAETAEKTQQVMMFTQAEVKKLMLGSKENPGPGKVFPYVLGLDSYAGAPAQESTTKVVKDGHASRGYSELALSYSRFLPVYISEIANWPFGLIVVNHLSKDTQAEVNGVPVYKTKGGTAVNFREGLEFHIFRKAPIRTSMFSGIDIEIRNAKNSFGPTGRRMQARLLSWVIDEPETGLPATKFMWDWHYSLAKLIPNMEGETKKRLVERGVNMFVQSGSSVNAPFVRMPALGMGQGEFLRYNEFGELLHSQPQVCDLLRDALNIRRRPRIIGPGPELTHQLLQGSTHGGE